MFQIVRLMDEQQSINKKIANQIPVIVQKSVQEQSKKPKRKGFLGIFGKKICAVFVNLPMQTKVIFIINLEPIHTDILAFSI